VKPEVTGRHPILGLHFCIDLCLIQAAVFRVFCLGYVSDRANFTITKIEAYKKNFEQKFGVLWHYNAAKRDLKL
jgi:hypothetical protein